jgi:SpoVK/Ycf46/Vps4 family AAA+-type ATPase
LEEFETFDGICIMTTNLSETIDEAFDRRILFKMKFDNPTKDVKKKIWKNKIDFLTEKDLEAVSEFDFSGGQIENIRRKITIDEVLYGTRPSLDALIDFCKKEKLHENDTGHIGFGAI